MLLVELRKEGELAVAGFMAGGEGAEARKRLEPAGGSEVAREAAGRVAAPGHAAGRGRAGVAASLGVGSGLWKWLEDDTSATALAGRRR